MEDLNSKWIVPNDINTKPEPKIVFKKGICALLSNDTLICQKDMHGLYWDYDKSKLYYYYREVIAWTYCISMSDIPKT